MAKEEKNMKFLITFKTEKTDHSTLEYIGQFELAAQYAKDHAKQIDPDCAYTIEVEKEINGEIVWAKVDNDGNVEGGGQVE